MRWIDLKTFFNALFCWEIFCVRIIDWKREKEQTYFIQVKQNIFIVVTFFIVLRSPDSWSFLNTYKI